MRISDWSSDVCSSDLVGILHTDLVEHRIDKLVVVEVGAAAEHDPRSVRIEHPRILIGALVDVLPAVEHRRSQRLAVNHRAGAWQPGLAKVDAKEIGAGVAEKFHDITSFDHGDALGDLACQRSEE